MSIENIAIDIIKEIGIENIKDVVKSLDDQNTVFVFLERNGENYQKNNYVKIKKAKTKAKNKDIDLIFIEVGSRESHDDKLISSHIKKKYQNVVNECAVHIEDNNAYAIVEINSENATDIENVSELVKNDINLFLSFLDIDLKIFHARTNRLKLTPLSVINAIRIIAPATYKDISLYLEEQEFIIEGFSNLNKILDRLRKQRFIFRKSSGEYVLTLDGLTSIGTEKNRQSPDIRRALALRRRKVLR